MSTHEPRARPPLASVAFVLVLALLLAGAGPVRAVGGWSLLPWGGLSSGGGPATSSSYSLVIGSIGGSVAGVTSNRGQVLTAGLIPGFFPPSTFAGLALAAGWNLVGVSSPLPLVAVPGFQQCFGYQNGWSVLGTGDMLLPGLGYWLQVADAVDVILPGLATVGPINVTYEAGWQLLGNPYSVPVPVTGITHWDLVATCFLYGPAWGSVDLVTGSLEPGRGYWINLTAPTTMTLTRP